MEIVNNEVFCHCKIRRMIVWPKISPVDFSVIKSVGKAYNTLCFSLQYFSFPQHPERESLDVSAICLFKTILVRMPCSQEGLFLSDLHLLDSRGYETFCPSVSVQHELFFFRRNQQTRLKKKLKVRKSESNFDFKQLNRHVVRGFLKFFFF